MVCSLVRRPKMQAFKGWRLKTDEDLSLEISYEIGEGTVEIRE